MCEQGENGIRIDSNPDNEILQVVDAVGRHVEECKRLGIPNGLLTLPKAAILLQQLRSTL